MEGPCFIEQINNDFVISSGLSQVYHTRRSQFQSINVVETKPWGKCLILDGHLQSSEKDEFVYHENLVHPILLAHPNPKSVFVGGGGEGATIREILRHKTVERIVMVDIDKECVEVSRKYLTGHHQGSFDDPRVTLVIDDAKAWLENTEEKFDIIIQDLCDPVEDTPAQLLYTQKYFEMCKTRLNEGGALITQGGPAGVLTHQTVFTAIANTISQVFPSVITWKVAIPSFIDDWGFVIGSIRNEHYGITTLSAEEIDHRINERLINPNVLKFYDGELHSGMFKMPKNIRQSMKDETRVITEENPLVIP